MNPFEYIAPRSLEEACELLARYGPDAHILAGGTDLLIEWRRPKTKGPGVIVDLSAVQELKGIGASGTVINIKPLTTHKDLMKSILLRSQAPLLAVAASVIGSPQIRNRGTIGGNIMNAATCADTVPPLVALLATVTLLSKTGSRQMSITDLFVKPYHTKAEPDEALTAIEFPKLPTGARSAFIKLGRRNALSISRLSVAAVLVMDEEKRISEARIAPGAALPTWQRVREAEELLLGKKPSHALFAEAGKVVADVMIAHSGRRWSTEYKEPVIAVLVRRALEACNS